MTLILSGLPRLLELPPSSFHFKFVKYRGANLNHSKFSLLQKTPSDEFQIVSRDIDLTLYLMQYVNVMIQMSQQENLSDNVIVREFYFVGCQLHR